MRSMRADRKLELKQKLVGDIVGSCVINPSVLPANLAEFAWPERQSDRLTNISRVGIVGSPGSVETDSSEPSASKLVIAREEPSVRVLPARWLFAAAPNRFGPADKRPVNGPPEWTPADGRIKTNQI